MSTIRNMLLMLGIAGMSSSLWADTKTYSNDFPVWSPGKQAVHVEIRDWNPDTGAFTTRLYGWSVCARFRTFYSNPATSTHNQPQTLATVPFQFDGRIDTWTVKILNVDDPNSKRNDFRHKGDVLVSYDAANAPWNPGGNMYTQINPLPDVCPQITTHTGAPPVPTYPPNSGDCERNPGQNGCFPSGVGPSATITPPEWRPCVDLGLAKVGLCPTKP